MSGCSSLCVSALSSQSCPGLRTLDLCWAVGVKDSQIKDLIVQPGEALNLSLLWPMCTVWVKVTHSLFLSFTSTFSCHTGSESRSRLRGLLTLRLSGLDVSDSTLKMIVRHMPSLRRLDLSHCQGLTDQSINLLTATGCNTRNTLRQLNLSGTWSLKIPLIFDPTRQITCDWCCRNQQSLVNVLNSVSDQIKGQKRHKYVI